VILGALAIYVLRLALGRIAFDFWFSCPVILLGICALVSAVSSAIFFPQPLLNGILALYAMVPLMLIALYRLTGARAIEIVMSIALAGLVVSALIIADRVVRIDFLSVYQRLSGFDAEMRRIVIAKNEVACATVILGAASMLTFPRRISMLYLTLFAAVFYTLIIVFEVRVAIGAVMLALGSFAVFGLKGRRRIFILAVGSIVGLALVPILFDKYIEQILTRSDFIIQDQSVSWRLITLEYYRRFFELTGGVGFGAMSGSGDNILAFAQSKAGALYGDPWYGLYLADISLFSALFQYGYLGLTMVLVMEIATIVALLRANRIPTFIGKIVAAIGLLCLFLIVNPWPLNMYTLEWCLVNSGTLWFLASLAARRELNSPI